MPIGICPEIEATFEHAGKGVIYIYMYYIYVFIVWGHDDLVHFKHCSERIQHIQSTSFLFEYTDCVHVSLSIFILYVY